MWKLKGCPRCSGDVFIHEDVGETYEQCLQCSFVREIRVPTVPQKESSLKRKRKLSILIPGLHWRPTKISGIPFQS